MWNTDWEYDFLFSLNCRNKAECIVCNQVLKKMTAYSLKRHYGCCHSELHTVIGNNRTQLILKLKNKLRLKNNNIIHPSYKSNNITICSQLKASYLISLGLAKKGRPLEDGVFFKEMCLSIMKLFGQPGQQVGNIIKDIPLSPQTVTRRIEDIGLFLQAESNEKIQNAKYISVCFDESVDLCDTSQMIICIRTVDNDFNSFEEILKLESFYGNVTGKTIFDSFQRNVLSLINTNKLSAICTDGAAVMVGRKNGFVGHLIKAGIEVPTFHCIIHQQALFSKTLGLMEAMKTAVKIINRLRGGHNALTHRKLVAFLKEIDADYGDVLMFTEVRWLSRGKCLERLFNLREEIAEFFQAQANPKDADILDLIKSHDFLLDLAFLTDITLHINNLNLVLQGKNKNICDLLYAINEFSRKLTILRDEIASQNLFNFPKTKEIFNRISNINRLKDFGQEINAIIENVQRRFLDFRNMEWIINIYNNPLTCLIENFPEKIKIELSMMRQDLFIPTENGIHFWKNICPIKYSTTRDLILNLFSIFPTTYICESTFSVMSQIKSKYRNKLTDSHLEALLKIKCYNGEINIDKLIEFTNSNRSP